MDCSPPLVVLVPWRCHSAHNLSKRSLVSRYTCYKWTFKEVFSTHTCIYAKLKTLKACSHIFPPMELIDRQPASRDNSNKQGTCLKKARCSVFLNNLYIARIVLFILKETVVCQLTYMMHIKGRNQKTYKLLIRSLHLSLQLASQVGYIAERKVSRCESTAWMASIYPPDT